MPASRAFILVVPGGAVLVRGVEHVDGSVIAQRVRTDGSFDGPRTAWVDLAALQDACLEAFDVEPAVFWEAAPTDPVILGSDAPSTCAVCWDSWCPRG